ncbi:response regulator [Paenibacillus sp. J5C_2022]|uniref:response regulator transcription factor n=1 Tax=Paenibacillus sp. J5C2022 TaxID=2977129 RepID=UPI0021D321F4|nr:response regulator [Paenibacillus sp. J5C2022]MCU6709933.1 response regulator [Paenibacillus sp. J5C2022]
MHKVFLVDDERWILESIKAKVDWESLELEFAGQASNGLDAYGMIQQTRPELVLTDIRMPGMNGLQLMESIKKLGLSTRFVVISGYAEFDYARKALELGALGYVLKSMERQELNDTLRNVKRSIDSTGTASRYLLLYEQLRGRFSDLDELNNYLLQAILRSSAELPLPTAEQTASVTGTFNKIVKYIQEHFNESISIGQIADHFDLHPNYISQLFRREKDTTFTAFLLQIRLDRACLLLEETNMTVNEIAEKVGYNDYYYFAKVFKKHIGMTPTLRRELKGCKFSIQKGTT